MLMNNAEEHVQPYKANVAERMMKNVKPMLEAIEGLCILRWPLLERHQSTGTKMHPIELSGTAAAITKAKEMLEKGAPKPLHLNNGHLHSCPVTFCVAETIYSSTNERAGRGTVTQHVKVAALPGEYEWEVTCNGTDHRVEADFCKEDVMKLWNLEQCTVHLCKYFPPEIAQKVLSIYATHGEAERVVYKRYYTEYFSSMGNALFQIMDDENAGTSDQEKEEIAKKKADKKALLEELDKYWVQVVYGIWPGDEEEEEEKKHVVKSNHKVPIHLAVRYFAAVGMSSLSQQFFELLRAAPAPTTDLLLEDAGKVWGIKGCRQDQMADLSALARSCRSLPADDEGADLTKSYRAVSVPLAQLEEPGQEYMAGQQPVVREQVVEVTATPDLTEDLKQTIGSLADGMEELSRNTRQFPRIASAPHQSPFVNMPNAKLAVASTRAPGVVTYVFGNVLGAAAPGFRRV